MPPHLKETLAAMESDATPQTYEEFLDILGGSLSKLSDITRSTESSLDVSEFDSLELKSALRARFQDTGRQVLAAWPTDRTAVKISCQSLIDRIDDLWYPSMDDLVIVDGSSEGNRVIILDHEERLFAASLED
jgi:hypothetical protein